MDLSIFQRDSRNCKQHLSVEAVENWVDIWCTAEERLLEILGF
jgi:hypothetical protein